METTVQQSVKQRIAEDNTVMRCLVGSKLHGLNVPGQDDRDEMGVCIEPPAYVIGLSKFEHYTHRTAAEGERSGPGDLDLTIYSLRKWTRLALGGNPTILTLMFVPEPLLIRGLVDAHLQWSSVAQGIHTVLPPLLAARSAGKAFLGYMTQQRERLEGIRAGRRKPSRPELIEAHGFDCYLDDTEFLTENGWLRYEDIQDEDLATIASDGTVEFQQPTERVCKPYSGSIVVGRSRYSEWAVTPNHRMFVSNVQRGACGINGNAYDLEKASWGFRRADELISRSWHSRVAGAPRTDEYLIDDEMLSLVGAYVSDGCVGKRRKDGSASVLRFEQKDGGRLHAIMEKVEYGWPLRSYRYARPTTIWTLADRGAASSVAVACKEGSRSKRLPAWARLLSVRQAEILLEALLAGDGTPYRTGGWVYYTISEKLAGDVQALAVGAGRRSNVWGPYEKGMYQVFIQDSGREIITTHPRNVSVEQVHDRRVVCFTVPNETLVTRRNGRVAMHGNTKYAMHVCRLGYQGCEFLERGHITLPMPNAEREFCYDVRRGRIAFAEVIAEAKQLEVNIKELTEKGPLPEKPDFKAVNYWLVEQYENHWRAKGEI